MQIGTAASLTAATRNGFAASSASGSTLAATQRRS
eukprot:CAMPEP_0113985370 /NCGR_PEP_ID=MMETSP0328-20130328/5895_1 /TAXON_ID=39455 /ORGANISM="Alexandrium minutum" /LENGTH=34 /assembly_acc=CAM_ASM_000350